jgi:hypothetical protein
MRDAMFALADNLESLGRSEFISRFLDLVGRLVREDKAIGVRHPLGFCFFDIAKIVTGCNLRLHIWSDEERPLQDSAFQIHDHRFSFVSRVLLGRLRNMTFTVVDEKGAENCLYRVLYDSEGSTLEPTGTCVRTAQKADNEQGPDSIYRVERGTFHSTLVTQGTMTVTLLRVSDDVPADPLVVGPCGRPVMRYVRTTWCPESQRDLLETTARLVAAQVS